MSALPDYATFTVQPAPDEEPPALSGLEWKVVSLALRESEKGGCAGVRQPGPIGRALRVFHRAVTGARGTLPLADPRLETLRRFVCMMCWGNSEAEKLAARLIDMGFTQSQIRAVALLVGR